MAPSLQHYVAYSCEAYQVPGSQELRSAAQDLPGQPLVVFSDCGTDCYTHPSSIPKQQRVGSRGWTVVSAGSDSVQDDIKEMQADMKHVKAQISQLQQDAAADAQLWGPLVIRNAASEALLFACHEQPQSPGRSKRFERMCRDKDKRLAAFADSLPMPSQPELLAPVLDCIISRRNSTVHFESEADLYELAIKPAQQLLDRHPALERALKQEATVLRCYDELREAFKF